MYSVYVVDILYVYMCGGVCVQRVYVYGMCIVCMRYCAYVCVCCVCWKCVPPISFLLTVEYRETAFLQIPLSLIFVLLTPVVLKVLLPASAT